MRETWMYEQVHGTSIVIFYAQDYFAVFQKNPFPLYPKVRGSQFWQHGDQDIDWEIFFYLLAYFPGLVSNGIYRLSKK